MNDESWIMDHGWWMMNDKCWMMTGVKQCGWNIIHQHLDVWYIFLSTGGCSRAGNWVTITMTMSMEASCIGYVGKPPMLLQTDAFTHRCLWFHEVSMYTGVYTQMLLHREVFAQRPFYAQTCLHKETVIQSCFCTEVLHRTVFTQPLLRTETVA